MKAITIYQPWASLVILGLKQYESRSWQTPYRGPLAIHAAARKVDENGWRLWSRIYCDAGPGSRMTMKAAGGGIAEATFLPLGEVLGIVEVEETFFISNGILDNPNTLSLAEVDLLEQITGDWSAGRWAWRLRVLERFAEPIPARGRQRLWLWEDPR